MLVTTVAATHGRSDMLDGVFFVAWMACVDTRIVLLRLALLAVAQALHFVCNMLHGSWRHVNAPTNICVWLLERGHGAVGAAGRPPALSLARDHQP